MRALVQRAARASVSVQGQLLGEIGPGLVVFIGIAKGDDEEDIRYTTDKVVNLRIFADEDGRFNRSALDTGAELLVISQFTLYAETRKGRRPSFIQAAAPEEAAPLFEKALKLIRASGLKVATGRFQERMLVEIHNDGPVTVMLDSADRERPRRAT